MKTPFLTRLTAVAFCCLLLTCCKEQPIEVMLLTGHTDKHHCWEVMSECVEDVLSEYPLFQTDIVLMPESSEDEFNPKFSQYDVVIINLNDVTWSDQVKLNFESYVKNGGGVVIIHEANNAFPEWKEYNRMIGIGGWGGRNEKDGPYYYWKDGEYITDNTPGKGGSHGRRVPFEVTVRNTEHPITRGLPSSWQQIDDELYSNLRGPAENIEVLATAFSNSQSGGSGKEEPVLFTVNYGKGRIFHTVLGHTRKDFTRAVRENRGFQVSLSRGVEWAATGDVKQESNINF